MKLLVCGGAGLHRLELRPPARAPTTATRSSCSTSSPTPAGARTWPTTATPSSSCTARSRTPSRRRGDRRRRRRDRQLRRRDARRPLDHRARRVRRDQRARHAACCWRPRASAASRATCRSRPTRSTARSRRARSPRSRRSQPSSPYSASKAGADLLVPSLLPHLRPGDADLPRLQQLRAVPVPREAHPADGPQRAARRPAAGLRRRHAGAQLALRRGLRPRASATSLAHGAPGEAYNVGGPDECPNIEVVKRIIEQTGSDESLIEYVTDRPGHDRRYSLGSEKVRALGWEAQVRFDEGLERTVALVPRQRRVVGADPLRRLPRVLRAPVRARAGLSARRSGSPPHGSFARDRRRRRHVACATASACRAVVAVDRRLDARRRGVPVTVTVLTVRSKASASASGSLTPSSHVAVADALELRGDLRGEDRRADLACVVLAPTGVCEVVDGLRRRPSGRR